MISQIQRSKLIKSEKIKLLLNYRKKYYFQWQVWLLADKKNTYMYYKCTSLSLENYKKYFVSFIESILKTQI